MSGLRWGRGGGHSGSSAGGGVEIGGGAVALVRGKGDDIVVFGC